ncbi:MAG: DUF5317 family protein [Saccharofermentanales bacterium]
MFETIILAMLLAKIRGYRIALFFKSWTIYPFLAIELLHLFFQIQVFMGNYYFIQFAPYLKKAYLFCFIIPIIIYKEYLQGIIGSVSVVMGTLLNKFVMAQNGGRMPVFPSFSYHTGYVKPDSFALDDGIHILGGADTRFWYLSDFIDVGYSIMSIGDVMIRVLVFLVIFKTIQVMNPAESQKSTT